MKIMHRYNSEERQHFLLDQQYSFKLRPKLLYSGFLSKHEGWKDQMHSHNFVEVLFVSGGSGFLFAGDLRREISAGDVVIYNANLPHQELSSRDDPLELLFMALDKVDITDLPYNHLIPADYDLIYPSGDMEEIFRTYFSGLVKEMSQKDKFYIEIAKNTANALVMYVFRLINRYRDMTELSAGNSTLETVLAYIDKHYLEAVSLEQIAGACHISKYYLSHLFSDVIQQTVGQYILNRRLAHAAHLLAVTNAPVADVALSAGFNNPSYFSRAFKKAFQATPLAYRKTHQK